MITRFSYEQLKGQPFKLPCRVVATTNISDFSNASTQIDGLQLVIGDRILVNNQTNPSENGIYVVKTSTLWERSLDASSDEDFVDGLQVFIKEGTYSGKTFNLDITTNFQLNQSSISFIEYLPTSATTYTKQLISGGAIWSGVGLTFSVSVLQYTFTGPLLTAGPTSVSLNTGDPTYSRFDAIVVDESGLISVLEGAATPDPVTPSIPDDQLLVQYVSVDDNAVTPSTGVTSSEYIYRENDYWTGGTFSTNFGTSSVNFLYTGIAPFQGTYSTRVILNSTTSVRWTRGSSILLKDYSYLIFRVYFPSTVANNKTMRIIWRRGSTNVGSYAYPFTNGGVSRTTTGAWQLCVLSLNYFGAAINELTSTGQSNTIDNILIGFSGGAQGTYVQALIDELYLVGGYSTPATNTNISIQSNGTLVGSRSIINFISGSGSSVVVTDSNLNNRVDVLISASSSASGTSGTSGINGSSGTSGLNGTSGTSGLSGTSGTSAIDGTSGTSGINGTSGTSGINGTSGTSGLLSLTGTTNNGLITLDGTAPNGTVESNLTFDGSTLNVTGNLFVSGSFSVSGSASSINTNSLVVSDPIIALGHSQSGSPLLDEGLMFVRGTGLTQAFIWDESEDTFALIGTNDDHTVIGNVNIDSYSNLRIGGLTTSNIKITSGASSGYLLQSDADGDASWVSLSSFSGVTGSGTTNYVPRWLSSSNLSSTSSIYDNGTNVGIGTNSPTYKFVVSSGVNELTYDPNSVRDSSRGSELFVKGTSSKITSMLLASDDNSIEMNIVGTGVVGGTIYGTAGDVAFYASSLVKNFNIINQVGPGSDNIRFYAGQDASSSNTPDIHITGNGIYRGFVGIGTASPTSKLYVYGDSTISGVANVLTVKGSSASSTVFSVQGTNGELFSITDNLVGSLFSVNDISGLPIIEAFSDNTVLIGDFMAPGLYTTKKTSVTASSTASIYSFATASYTSAHVDYNIQNGTNARAGSLMAIWQGSSIQFTENSTLDIGTTSGFTFSFVISGTYAVLQAVASTSTWTVKTLIRGI